jgi:hypothetical protein
VVATEHAYLQIIVHVQLGTMDRSVAHIIAMVLTILYHQYARQMERVLVLMFVHAIQGSMVASANYLIAMVFQVYRRLYVLQMVSSINSHT